MKRFILALVLTVGLVGMHCATPPAPTQPSIVGSYAVAGTNADGTAYTLNIRLESTPSGLFVLQYIEQGQVAAVGFGILSENVLSVIFQTGNGMVGLASFTVAGENLTGQWMMPGIDGMGTEILTPVDAIPMLPAAAPEAPVGHAPDSITI